MTLLNNKSTNNYECKTFEQNYFYGGKVSWLNALLHWSVFLLFGGQICLLKLRRR